MSFIIRHRGRGIALLLIATVLARAAESDGAAIDWSRARALRAKVAAGETLSDEDRAYLDRAIAARKAGGGGVGPVLAQLTPEERELARTVLQKRRSGEPLTETEQALQAKVERMAAEGRRASAANAGEAHLAPRDHTGLVPLDEMSGEQRYQGRDGGLYGQGRNRPPAALQKLADAAVAKIVPRDAAGKASADGKIALLSVGMSNTTQEFSRFKELADQDPAKAKSVVLIDGAQGGQAAAQWAAGADNDVWKTVDHRLEAGHITPAQVQVVWLKQAEIRPTEAFPADAKRLTDDLVTIVRRLKDRFPNLEVAYLSSRIYGGYATTALNPEPYAYDGAFAVRDLIDRQLAGDPTLNCDPAHGPVKAPVLLWGPYLWADGITPRKSDGLVWRREDLREDGTHPSATSGRDKVAKLLLTFCETDPTARRWFVGTR